MKALKKLKYKNTTINKKTILLISLSLILNLPVLAIDINDMGDFSSRSVIMRPNQNQKSDNELINILMLKKIYPTSQYLVKEINENNFENVSLLVQTGMDLNQSFFGEYPIYRAAKKNNFEILKLLHENGAKLDRSFYSELYEAVKNKNEAMAQYLIENNAKINYTDAVSNNTIVSMALKNNMINIAQQLIQKGANLDSESVKIIKKKKLDIKDFTQEQD